MDEMTLEDVATLGVSLTASGRYYVNDVYRIKDGRVEPIRTFHVRLDMQTGWMGQFLRIEG